jgi:hypothetical protein
VWAWVGIVLAVAVLAFLAGRGVKPAPTPTVIAEVTTPAVPFTAMPQPTATPMVPTLTPLPPTDTPVPTSTPRPTVTPVPPTNTPTRTPRPAPTPTATIDADPTVYDNFNNPANDGSFNQSQWGYWFAPPPNSQVAQQDGMLVVTKQSALLESPELAAHKYDRVTLNTPTFFEAKLMLNSDKHEGGIKFKLHANLLDFDWLSECSTGYDGWASCYDWTWPEEEHAYKSESKSVGYGTWHTFRIEVEPATMTFAYYIDGQMVGSHVPVDAEKLKKARFTLTTGVYGEEVTGYIDDVRVGPVQ